MKDRSTKFFVCPNCSSTDISVSYSNPLVWQYGLPNKYVCNACHRVLPWFPEVDKDALAEVQKKFLEKEKSNKGVLVDVIVRVGNKNNAQKYLFAIFMIIFGFLGIAVSALFLLLLLPVFYLFWKDQTKLIHNR